MATADAATVKRLLDHPPPGLVVLDVRTPEEWAGGRLPGATLIDFYSDDFVERISELDRSAPYLVYCRVGARSARTAEFMGQIGFTNVTDFSGGWLEWSDADHAIER